MSEGIAIVVPLVAFIVLAIAFVVVLRRASRLLAETRAQEQFRLTMDERVAVVDAALEQIATRIDGVRRHEIAAAEIEGELRGTIETIRLQSARLPEPMGRFPADDVRASLLSEFERAARALDLVAHGCGLMGTVRGGPGTEGQTELKRGYLGILHAREAIIRHAADLEPAAATRRRAIPREHAALPQDASKE